MTSQVLHALEKRGWLNHSRKEGDELSEFSEITDAVTATIPGVEKSVLKAEESFFAILGKNKEGFDEH